MNYFYLIAGILLVLAGLLDFGSTSFILTKTGFITSKTNQGIAKFCFFLAGNRGDRKILEYLGSALIFFMFVIWLVVVWTGFSLIFMSDPESIYNSSSEQFADTYEKIYYTGFTLSTLGVGDFTPHSDGWRIITSLASFVGLILITMAITYLVPVISNAIQKRSLSLYISGLGESPEQIVISAYNGKDFSQLSDHLTNLGSMIFQYSQNHLAYPILHYMHNSNKDENVTLQVACLDETLTILMCHIPPELRPPSMSLQLTRRAITAYLETIKQPGKEDNDLPYPNLKHITEATGVSLINNDEASMQKIYGKLDKRRQIMCNMLLNDGWKWKQIQGSKYESDLHA